ncbi:NifU family protein [Anaplasma bovis]|uniref:NifU family protein n=1 Tax=Anaplasma bovis TaxID=186733 RepID=UPI002FEE69F7
MFIQIEDTPNPDTLKFLLNTEIPVAKSGVEFSNSSEAMTSPLAKLLFEVEGVASVYFGGDFVSVTKVRDISWDVLRPEVLVVLTDYFSAGKHDASYSGDSTAEEEEFFDAKDESVVQKIKDLIENYVRPAVAQDGGDIRFRGYKEGVVYVHLRGACSGCPSAEMTLKDGVYGMLSYYIPEISAVENV